jgi:hypothetical protein
MLNFEIILFCYNFMLSLLSSFTANVSVCYKFFIIYVIIFGSYYIYNVGWVGYHQRNFQCQCPPM